MSEIEKMYKNAEVKKQIPKICSNNELYCKDCTAHIEDAMPYCKSAEYPPFTAEKQIELIKWLAIKDCIFRLTYEREYLWCSQLEWQSSFCYEHFEESLANLVNTLWQDLTEAERAEIKNILEEIE